MSSKTIDWDKVKDIISKKYLSVQSMCNAYIDLRAEGIFSSKNKNPDRWWLEYEKEMRERGIDWNEAYKNFPMIIKFLSDISENDISKEANNYLDDRFSGGTEVMEEVSPEMLYFEGILFKDCGSMGKVAEDKTDEAREECRTSRRVKFIVCILEMCGLALTPTKGFQKMYCLIGKGQDGKSILLSLFDKVMNNTINRQLLWAHAHR